MGFKFVKQVDKMDCGPACLKMIAHHYGRTINTEYIRQLAGKSIDGSSMLGLSEAGEKIGFRTMAVKLPLEPLKNNAPFPFLAHMNQNHFVIVYKISKSKIFVADPAFGLTQYTYKDFLAAWAIPSDSENAGVALLFEPTNAFYQNENDPDKSVQGLAILWNQARKHKKLFVQLILALGAASLIQLIFPFLTQSVVDVGIANKDINFIYVILLAQIFFFLGKSAIEFIRAWIPLHISTRVNISIVSEFLIKLMRLPISFFNGRVTGDLIQRINDHRNVEILISGSSLAAIFACMNLVVFSVALAWYSMTIFLVFALGTAAYMLWVIVFLKRRRILNYREFTEVSNNQSKIIELLSGMQEIKLHNAERQKRWEWERIQVNLFKISAKVLSLEQTQSLGSSFINEAKNIAITFLAATMVINGSLTLGMMLSISYMIGQLNAPVVTIVTFIHAWQDAKISMERIGEIHSSQDEEPANEIKLHELAVNQVISVKNISFRYPGAAKYVLNDVSFDIPTGKTTAIVGASGSGKTTLMKILLKFYNPDKGEIRVGNDFLAQISQKEWRTYCGAVMQEGFIFNDTIARNISIGHDYPEPDKLNNAMNIAHIRQFVSELPLGYNTKIGNEGIGLSTGQKQRLLIARAVYKNPQFVLFDEATSSLDATSERIVMENLTSFLQTRTAVVIAHRLSTVKNAHQIVVLGNGEVLEIGDHNSLIAKQGYYFNLVRHQLQLETLENPLNLS